MKRRELITLLGGLQRRLWIGTSPAAAGGVATDQAGFTTFLKLDRQNAEKLIKIAKTPKQEFKE